MTNAYDAIINPVKGKDSPELGPLAVMVASQNDLDFLCRQLNLGRQHGRNFFMSRLFVGNGPRKCLALTGPMIGAPYAVMLLETLIAWGTQKIIFFGWCGAVSPKVKIGDIIVPAAAMVDEGTSRHYAANENLMSGPSQDLLQKIKTTLQDQGLCFHEGLVWSTDAIYRETREKVEHLQGKDVLAVEMEMSAIFSVGRYRQVDVGGILVVSDEVSSFKWRPGFKNSDFKQGRQHAANVICRLLKIL
ncbi:nucleoside phosphorylase [Thermodesulfobacteriota bacterium]